VSLGQQEISELIGPVISGMGCELWGVEFRSQSRHSVLRIYIDKVGGVGLRDCESVSHQISSLLDVEDIIPGNYTLEVSSPGIARPLYNLTQYQKYIGEQVFIKLSRSFEGRKKFSGTLAAVEEDEVVVQIEDEQLVLPFEWIEKARLEPTF
jgi:ribosome maturation factor RimP